MFRYLPMELPDISDDISTEEISSFKLETPIVDNRVRKAFIFNEGSSSYFKLERAVYEVFSDGEIIATVQCLVGTLRRRVITVTGHIRLILLNDVGGILWDSGQDWKIWLNSGRATGVTRYQYEAIKNIFPDVRSAQLELSTKLAIIH